MLINAVKSSNIYKMDKDTNNEDLTESITKTYKKSNRYTVNKINIEAKKIVTKLKIGDRFQQFHEAEALITVKNHIDNFPNFPTLINHSKSETGKISKQILNKINNTLVS